MGLFDTFEQTIASAINAQVHEEMKPAFQLLDDRIVALEQGKVQPTSEDQQEKVVRVVTEVIENDVPNLISDAIAEADFDDAISTWFEYNIDIDSAVENAMSNSFDPSDYDLVDQSEFSELQDEVNGLSSKVEDLEALADSMDVLADKVGILEGKPSDEPNYGFDAETEIERLRNRIDEVEEGGVGEDEVISLRNEIAGLEDVISSIRSDVGDIKQAIQSFGASI